MNKKTLLILTLVIILPPAAAGCRGSTQQPPAVNGTGTSPSQATQTSAVPTAAVTLRSPQEVILEGPDCPDTFEKLGNVSRRLTLTSQDTLLLQAGSTPSVPSGWAALQIHTPELIEQTDHRTIWPAEGATAQPGAPGTEIWEFSFPDTGRGSLTLTCTGLDEQGAEVKTEGVFELTVEITAP